MIDGEGKKGGKGLYPKYTVKRVDGRSEAGERHYLCEYFVLDLNHDIFARKALLAYAEACGKQHPELATDLYRIAESMLEIGTDAEE